MSALRTLDAHLHAALDGRGVPAAAREQVVGLCRDLVATVEGLDVPHPGRAVRDAVHLVVGTSAPCLSQAVRGDVARVCEVWVVRGP